MPSLDIAKIHQSHSAGMSLRTGSLKQVFRAYYTLTKPTITLLVAVTVVPSLILALGRLPSLSLAFFSIVGASLCSASAAAFNQIVESRTDQQMARTKKRSIPDGKVQPIAGIVFGVIIGTIGFLLLYLGTTPLAAYVALAGHLFYVLIYTMYLKKATPQNIVIGGAAGAVGPLIGWAAVSGDLGWPAWSLFMIIFIWTPPHFWSLALKYKEDYKLAGIPMYPNIYGDHKTLKAMSLYSASLIPFVVSLYFTKPVGLIYLIPSLGFTLKFFFDSLKLFHDHSPEKVMKFFLYSCLYLFAVFGALTLDLMINI